MHMFHLLFHPYLTTDFVVGFTPTPSGGGLNGEAGSKGGKKNGVHQEEQKKNGVHQEEQKNNRELMSTEDTKPVERKKSEAGKVVREDEEKKPVTISVPVNEALPKPVAAVRTKPSPATPKAAPAKPTGTKEPAKPDNSGFYSFLKRA